MKKIFFNLIILIFPYFSVSQTIIMDSEFSKNSIVNKSTPNSVLAPSNDNCNNATVLTIDGGCTVGTTSGASTQGGECVFSAAYTKTVWYRVSTGANTTLNLAWIYTNTPNCIPAIVIFGPFASGSGCIPTCAQAFYFTQNSGDPGYHAQITGLSTNSDYLISVESASGGPCGNAGQSDLNFCIGFYTVPTNDVPASPTNLNNCGTTFNANNQGYSPDGTGTSKSNLDANNTTTCGTCAAGNDVPYVVNNDQWFYFCTTNAGTYNITINNISNCVLSAPNSGVQASILLGPTTSFTNLYNFPNPMAPGTNNTSSNFALSAGDCVYIPVDGFAGDQCTYSFTLNNVSGGCNILPIELLTFSGEYIYNLVKLKWITATEINCDYFTIEYSNNGQKFVPIGNVKAAGNSLKPNNYSFIDNLNVLDGLAYYKLTEVDFNGSKTDHNIIVVDIKNSSKLLVKRYNLLGETVDETYIGIIFLLYDDGSIRKAFQN